MQLITIVIGCLAYVTGKQSETLGIYTPSKSSIYAHPEGSVHIENFELDSDDTFYLDYGLVCKTNACPQIGIESKSGTFISRLIRSSNLNNTYNIKFRPNRGKPFQYKVSYLNNSNTINVWDGHSNFELVKQDDECKFGDKIDVCQKNTGVYAKCASDNKCRVSGRLNTPCETNENCFNNYQCRNSFCRK